MMYFCEMPLMSPSIFSFCSVCRTSFGDKPMLSAKSVSFTLFNAEVNNDNLGPKQYYINELVFVLLRGLRRYQGVEDDDGFVRVEGANDGLRDRNTRRRRHRCFACLPVLPTYL